MNVQSISLAQQRNNSQQTFNGYVDKPVIKLIDGLTQSSMDKVVRDANLAYQKVDIRKLSDIQTMGKAIINKLNHYMENFHKKTVLTLDESRTSLVIKNKVLGTDVGFEWHKRDAKNTGRLDKDFCYIDAYAPSLVGLSYNNLQEFNNLADVLVKAPRKEEIDNYLFKNFTKNITKQANNTSFFAGLKTKRNGKKADKLATEFNQPTGWLGKLLEIRNNAIQKKEEAKRLAKERKMLEKANTKTAKEVAKK